MAADKMVCVHLDDTPTGSPLREKTTIGRQYFGLGSALMFHLEIVIFDAQLAHRPEKWRPIK